MKTYSYTNKNLQFKKTNPWIYQLNSMDKNIPCILYWVQLTNSMIIPDSRRIRQTKNMNTNYQQTEMT